VVHIFRKFERQIVRQLVKSMFDSDSVPCYERPISVTPSRCVSLSSSWSSANETQWCVIGMNSNNSIAIKKSGGDRNQFESSIEFSFHNDSISTSHDYISFLSVPTDSTYNSIINLEMDICAPWIRPKDLP
jgi:hypothetical protein